MAVVKIEKTKNYTVMSNAHLRDIRLSLKAKGLMSLMLSLPEDWDYTIDGLSHICKENYTAIKSGLDELKETGYLVVRKMFANETESGHIEYEYTLYEQPANLGDQGLEKVALAGVGVESQPQLNTNKQNTDHQRGDSAPTASRGSRRSLLNTPQPQTKKSSMQKVNRFIGDCEKEIARRAITGELQIHLMKFFRMLGESKTLLPLTTIQAQLDSLQSLPEDRQVEAVKRTVQHGWKSLTYCVDELKPGKTPDFDTAESGMFQAKTEEQKRHTGEIHEGEEVF